MFHLKLVYYFITFLTSIFTLAISFLLHIKKQSKLTFDSFLFVLNLAIISLAWLIHAYYSVLGEPVNSTIESSYILIENVFFMFLMSTLPRFIYSFFHIPHKKSLSIFYTLSISLNVFFLLYYFDLILSPWPLPFTVYQGIYTILGIVTLTGITFGILHYTSLKISVYRQMAKTLGFLLLLFIPVLFIDSLNTTYKEYIIISPLLLISFNCITIYFGIIQLFKLQDILVPGEAFYTHYNLSNREREILLLLLQDLTYKEIAQHAYISHATVKTHINKIYFKTGVKEKAELVSLIKKTY